LNEKELELNKEIEELVKDYNQELKKESENNKIQNNLLKNVDNLSENKENLNKKLQNLDLSGFEEDENLINFMTNLDYDKYVKNQEVREALFLLKNKVEKEKDVQQIEENQNKENMSIKEEDIEKNDEKEISLPPIDHRVNLIHEKDWDGKNLNDSEYLKKKMADKILKLDKNLKTVHSVQSIKRLLEREGFDIPTKKSKIFFNLI
jgi:hypothetical protein